MSQKPLHGLSWSQVGGAAFALSLATGAQAQAMITLYENNFETLNGGDNAPECINGVGDQQPQWGTFAADYSTTANPITQARTADRLCTDEVAGGNNLYHDPTGKAGKYTGGLLGEGENSHIEAVSLSFDPQGKRFLNVSIDWALVDIQFVAGDRYLPNGPRDVAIAFYHVPNGKTLTLNNDDLVPVPAYIDGTQATPIETQAFTVAQPPFTSADYQADYTKRYWINWQTQRVAADLSQVQLEDGDRVAIVFYPNEKSRVAYFAFDNLLITASDTAGGVTLEVTAPDSDTGLPTITGSSNQPAGTEVTLTITDVNSNTQTLTATLAADGTYSAVPTTALPAGAYTVLASIPNPVGGTETATATGAITAAVTPPPPPPPPPPLPPAPAPTSADNVQPVPGNAWWALLGSAAGIGWLARGRKRKGKNGDKQA